MSNFPLIGFALLSFAAALALTLLPLHPGASARINALLLVVSIGAALLIILRRHYRPYRSGRLTPTGTASPLQTPEPSQIVRPEDR